MSRMQFNIWSERITPRTVDTNVVVVSTTMALKFDCERLWLAFATGKHSDTLMQQPL